MTTISVRVPSELKQQAEELGLNKSEVMRSALAEEVRRRRRERMAERRTQITTFDVDSSNETIVAAIRKSREEDAR